MFKWLLAFLLLVCSLCMATSATYVFSFHGAKPKPINDREFLRSYNMHNVNTLAALSRYGDILDKRYVARG